MKRIIFSFLICLPALSVFAQEEPVINKIKQVGGLFQSAGSGGAGGGRKDSIPFEHRDDRKDSIAIGYKFLDSVRTVSFDSSINDFDKYFTIPSSWQSLGNNGAAAYPLIYQNNARAGWDPGFHAFDVYKMTLEGTKFYKTNRPFTQLGYQLASGKEQVLKVLHTQSPRPGLNFGFDYRLINAPGFFVTQNSNHKSYRLFGNYQGKRKRYAAYLVLVGNTLKNSENGGIKYDSLITDKNHSKRFTIPVNLGGAQLYQPNPFQANIHTGNIYKDFTFFLRQSYDLGKRDSVAINDSTTEYLFYPKLRLQYSFSYNTQQYRFTDDKADSSIYASWYNYTLLTPTGSFLATEKWSRLSNDFSLLQFPETKNPAQFLLLGATLENITGQLTTGTHRYVNTILHGEYRNKTRNKLWDILAKGEFYLHGLNSGDYTAQASIGRYFNKKFGYVRLYFRNVNRTPSFIFNNESKFNFNNPSLTKKENITVVGADLSNALFNLSFRDYFISNLCYFTDYYHTAQYGTAFNLLQVTASKMIKLTKKWHWYAEITAQQTDGAAPVKVPLIFTRNRLAFEGLFYKNLNLSTGLELRYFTPFEAYNYSPVMGQFIPQDTFKLKNLPDISLFFHFRIKSFTTYIRAENLNTVSFANGFRFTNNNYAAPHYPSQAFMLRVGIQWGFVN
ncbi:MAG: putative porin [Ferruginibacter sp.]